jgi:hypothetical protein
VQTGISIFCKKVKMESSKRTRVVQLAREKKAITNHYIIKSYLQQKIFPILIQLFGEAASRIVKT